MVLMSDVANPEPNPAPATPDTSQAPNSLEEVTEVLAEFERYRQRLVDDTVAVAKKAKMPKSVVMAQLQPELDKIDGLIANLKQQQASLGAEA
jgi:hypothetical protein